MAPLWPHGKRPRQWCSWDAYGNFVGLTYVYNNSQSTTITIVDQLNRTTTINTSATTDTINYPGQSSTRRTITINKDSLQNHLVSGETLLPSQCLFPELSGIVGSNNPTVVASVTLADGSSSYSFQYNTYGELALYRLPTGGAYRYIYSEAQGCAANTGSGVISGSSYAGYLIIRRVTERDELSDGVNVSGKVVYPAPVFGNADTYHGDRPTTLTEVDFEDPSGNLLRKEQHYFYGNPTSTASVPTLPTDYPNWSDGIEYQVITTGPNVWQLQYQVWGQRPCSGSEPCWFSDPQANASPLHDPRVCQVNTVLNDGTQTATLRTFDNSNNLTDLYEYDFGSSPAVGPNCPTPPNGWKRHTATLYRTDASYLDPSVYLLNLLSEKHVYNESGAQVAYTLLNYDELNSHPLQEAPGIVGHDAVYGIGFAARGNPTGIWHSEDGTNLSILTANTYDIAGNLVEQTDGNRHATTYEYNDSANVYAKATKIIDALGHATKATYDYGNGLAISTTDANQTYTYYTWDVLDRPTSMRVVNGSANLRQASYQYPDAQTVIENQDRNTPGDLALQSTTLYDGLGRVRAQRMYESSTAYIETTTSYDSLGQIASRTNPARPGDVAVSTVYSHDALGRLVSVQQPDGSTATNSYSGSATTMRDEAGITKVISYDWAGRIANVREDPAGLNYTTDYRYDALDNLTLVSQGYCPNCEQRSFTYDGLSRLRNATNPESGTVTYLYDGAGNLMHRTDARQITTNYSYDNGNRLTAKSSTDGSLSLSWTYDGGSNGIGRLTSVSSPSSATSYSYDALGQVTVSSQSTSGNAYNFAYAYNAAGSLVSETYPSGRTVTTSYDGANRPVQVSGSLNGQSTTYISGITYAAHGEPNSYLYGNGLGRTVQYNNRLQIGSSTDALQFSSASVLLGMNFGWTNNNSNNNDGVLRSLTISHGGPGYPQFLTFQQTYSYDTVNRLSGVSDTGGFSRAFGYDAWGNMSVTGSNGTPWSGLTPYSGNGANPFNSKNQLLSGSFDASGNQTVIGALQITYDAENHQTQTQDNSGNPAVTYAYDGNSQRVSKTAGSATTVYVYDAFGQLAAEYSNIATQPAPCQTCYLTYDHLGTPRMITDQNGSVISRHDYLPFGEELPAGYAARNNQFGSSDGVSQKFTGQMRDSETGMDYFNARYFGAVLGRFSSPDPANAGADLMDPQSWNGYAYVSGNPLIYTDPTGLARITCDNGVSADACVTATAPPVAFVPIYGLGGGQGSAAGPRKPAKQTPPKTGSCPSPTTQAVASAVIASNPLILAAAFQAGLAAKLRGGTAIVGIGGNASANILPGEPFGGSVGASLGIAVDPSGNVGLAGSWQFGGGFRASQSAGYSAGGTITSTRQPTIFSFNGSASPSVGISAGAGGIGGSISGSPTSGSVSLRAGLAGGLATFGGVSATRVLPLVCH